MLRKRRPLCVDQILEVEIRHHDEHSLHIPLPGGKLIGNTLANARFQVAERFCIEQERAFAFSRCVALQKRGPRQYA